MCGDGDWVDGVAVAIVDCLCESDAVEGAIDVVLWRNEVRELNEGEFLGEIDREYGEMSCEAKAGDEIRNLDNGARVWRAGPGHEDRATLCRFGRPERE